MGGGTDSINDDMRSDMSGGIGRERAEGPGRIRKLKSLISSVFFTIENDQTNHLLNQRSYGDIKHPSGLGLDPDVIALRYDDHDGADSRC